MGTPLNLNTIVHGSVGAIEEAANYFMLANSRAGEAADHYRKASTGSNEGWCGPAGAAFRETVNAQDIVSQDVEAAAKRYWTATADFVDRLNVVIDKMATAREKATAAHLEVHGLIILRPEHPGPAPKHAPDFVSNHVGVTPTSEAGEAFAKLDAAEAAYAQKVEAYNAKVAVFNECLALHNDARNLEKKAHFELQRALGDEADFSVDGWKIGDVTSAAMIGMMGDGENSRAEAAAKFTKSQSLSRLFKEFALTGMPSAWGQAARDAFLRNAITSGARTLDAKKQLRELDRLIGDLPEKMRSAPASYPGKEALGLKNVTIDYDGYGKIAAKGILTKLPYLGSGITVFKEATKAATGEQTWGRAVTNTLADLAGAGGAGALAAGGATLLGATPQGRLVAGAGGAILGSFGAQHVVDAFYPEEKLALPGSAKPIDYDPNWDKGG
ncbi:MAG: hypothetical protein ACRDQF_01595 [Thermocrispum sp.]